MSEDIPQRVDRVHLAYFTSAGRIAGIYSYYTSMDSQDRILKEIRDLLNEGKLPALVEGAKATYVYVQFDDPPFQARLLIKDMVILDPDSHLLAKKNVLPLSEYSDAPTEKQKRFLGVLREKLGISDTHIPETKKEISVLITKLKSQLDGETAKVSLPDRGFGGLPF